MGSKFVRNIGKVLKSATGVLFGRVTSGTGRGEELTPSDVRTLLSVYTVTQTDSAISTAINNLIGGSPGLLDTLDELAAALGDDANFASTVTTALAAKVNTSDLSESIDDRVAALLVAGTNISLTYNDAAGTLTIESTASGGSPGGSSGQVQFNNAGSFDGATAAVYAGTGTHFVVTAQAAATIPLAVRAAASQSGNLTEWRNSSGTVLSLISSAGAVTVGGNTVSPDCAARFIGRVEVRTGSHSTRIFAVADGAGFTLDNNIYGAAPAFHDNSGRWGVQINSVNSTTGPNSQFNVVAKPNGTGTFQTAMRCDWSTTAGETRLLLWDVSAGALVRVTVGAADSGGTGFKVLRVPN